MGDQTARFSLSLACLWMAAFSLWAPLAAWACVPGASLAGVTVQPRSSGPAGSTVTLEGFNFIPGAVEVRWNTLDGTTMGTATGPSFSSSVKIPPAGPGLYIVLVLSRQPDGSVADIVRTPFEVTGEGSRLARPTPDAQGGPVEQTDSHRNQWLSSAVAAGVLLLLTGAAVWKWRSRRPKSG